MPRARNIKPGFYKNDLLAECSIWARFIFPGLWMLADREGRLEHRPKKIKAEILPHDSVDILPLLDELESKKFIVRYQICDLKIIQIIKFLDHQKPHGTERDSLLPDRNGYLTVNQRSPSGLINGAPNQVKYVPEIFTISNDLDKITVKYQLKPVISPSNNALIPDSLVLIPDSLVLIPDSSQSPVQEEGNITKLDTGGDSNSEETEIDPDLAGLGINP